MFARKDAVRVLRGQNTHSQCCLSQLSNPIIYLSKIFSREVFQKVFQTLEILLTFECYPATRGGVCYACPESREGRLAEKVPKKFSITLEILHAFESFALPLGWCRCACLESREGRLAEEFPKSFPLHWKFYMLLKALPCHWGGVCCACPEFREGV